MPDTGAAASSSPNKTKAGNPNGLTAAEVKESNSLVLFQESINRELKYYRSSPPYHVSIQLKKSIRHLDSMSFICESFECSFCQMRFFCV